jgi:molybdate transport system regulatory protein
MARVSLRLGFATDQALGPGKIRLLELIRETGSISAAGREMRMSYRRAWNLVNELNEMFCEPVVAARPGGANGGGATLTSAGDDVVRRYRSIESNVETSSRAHIAALEKMTVRAVKPSRAPRSKHIAID